MTNAGEPANSIAPPTEAKAVANAPPTANQTPWQNLIFPPHWDAHLQHITQPIFQSGFGNPGFFDAAVRDATLYLETQLRDLCDAPPDLIGIDLVTHAFKPDNLEGYLLNPSIVAGEAQGINALFRGAVLQIRNPVGHRQVNLRPFEVFDILALVNYLLSIAGELARERFLNPFLPRWSTHRRVLSTRRINITGTGDPQIVVLFNEGNIGSTGAHGGVLILTSDATVSLPGALPQIAGYFVPEVIKGDVDGDGTGEIVVSFAGENNTRHGLFIDFDGSELKAIDKVDDDPFTSYLQQFEIKADGAIVAYQPNGQPRVVRLIDGHLTQV